MDMLFKIFNLSSIKYFQNIVNHIVPYWIEFPGEQFAKERKEKIQYKVNSIIRTFKVQVG